jgi:hypothetical protein
MRTLGTRDGKSARFEFRLTRASVNKLDELAKLRDATLPADAVASTRSDVLRELIDAAHEGSTRVKEYRP